MLGITRGCWESCCTASWWATLTLCATHTVYCKGRRSILGNDCRQKCCLLSSPSCRGISGDTSTATPAGWEETGKHNHVSVYYNAQIDTAPRIGRRNASETNMMDGVLWELEGRLCQLISLCLYVRKTPPHQPWGIEVLSYEFTAGYFWVGKPHCNPMRWEAQRIRHEVNPGRVFIRLPAQFSPTLHGKSMDQRSTHTFSKIASSDFI